MMPVINITHTYSTNKPEFFLSFVTNQEEISVNHRCKACLWHTFVTAHFCAFGTISDQFTGILFDCIVFITRIFVEVINEIIGDFVPIRQVGA